MNHPDYCAPDTLEEALARLGADPARARAIAGGTDLLVQMRAGSAAPALLVDLRRLPLSGITREGDVVVIGAGTTHTQIIESPLIAQHFPALAAACRSIGGPPVRNRGTLGGNLATASPAADSAPPLLAYDAVVELAEQGGRRSVPLAQFFVGYRRTALQPGEILTAVRLPVPPPRTAAVFTKLGRRNAMAIAVVSVAIRLSLDEAGQVSVARIALGSVAPVPLRALAAEALLAGQPPGKALFSKAAHAAREAASPITDLRASAEYRARMVEVLTARTLVTAHAALIGA